MTLSYPWALPGLSTFADRPRHAAPRGARPSTSGAPAPRTPPPPRRRGGPSPQVIRKRRLFVGAGALGVVALVVTLVVMLTTGGSPPAASAGGSSAGLATATSGSIDAAEAGLLPWTLPAPIWQAAVVAGTGTDVTVAGGGPGATIFSLNTAGGATTTIGTLNPPVAAAAAGEVHGASLVLGGASPGATSSVQRLDSTGSTPVGHLPEPRLGATAVTVGGRLYVVGGANGKRATPQVLATSDGHHFTTVTSLPDPVRFAAVAALDGRIYVLGGQAVGGPHSGSPLSVVQMVDPAAGTASVVAHLPKALMGASAAVLGGHLYVAGGWSGGAQPLSATTPPPGAASTSVYALDTATNKVLAAGTLPTPVAYAGVAVVAGRAWMVGGENDGAPVNTVEMFIPNKGFGTAGAPGAGSPYFGGKLLIADRGNNRLLLLNDQNQLIWHYPNAQAPPPPGPGGFYFPDDAFFIKHGTEIIINQEQNETIDILGFPSGKVLWQYGHPGQSGSSPGYLYEPDDAYLMKNGLITVADANNCRVLVINPNTKAVVSQIGSTGVCQHNPPTSLGSPNGDTPLKNGNLLISEIMGSWVSEYTTSGQDVWSTQLPISYPSDPQQLGPNRYLVSDYSTPGSILEFNKQGQILYRYRVTSGPGELNQPSLTELLPSGVFMSNDDYNDRMVAIDPATQALVWQYGQTGIAGTGPGQLNTPDGFDLLMPGGVTPTHPYTG